MQFSVKYLPTALFSLKDSNSTNSGAKALFLPSPYAIKMALLNQVITNGEDIEKNLSGTKSTNFSYIRDIKISFFIEFNSFFSINNSFVKILKKKEDKRSKKAKEKGDIFEPGLQQTVAFREYLFLSNPIEIKFEVTSENQKIYLQKYLHKINYFGKRGSFFQFLEYLDSPNIANVKQFNISDNPVGVLQEFDDFDEKTTFDNVSNFSSSNTKRIKKIFVLPLEKQSSSKSYTLFKSF